MYSAIELKDNAEVVDNTKINARIFFDFIIFPFLNMVQNDLTLRLTLLFYQKGYNQYILLYFQSILYLFSTDYPILIFPPILFDHWQHLLYFNAKVCFIDPVQKCDDTYYTLIEII